MQTNPLSSRFYNAIIGALLGDALGVPYEFKQPAEIPEANLIGADVVAGYSRSHPSVPMGIWSDDGAQTLCLLEALQTSTSFDPAIFARLLMEWRMSGYHQSGGRVFDIGLQTNRVCMRISEGGSLISSGEGGIRNNGNGSLMRNLPVPLWGYESGWDRKQIAATSIAQSRITHSHQIAITCCAVHGLIAHSLLQGESLHQAIDLAFADLRKMDLINNETLDIIRNFPKKNFCLGSGYAIDSLWSALSCLSEHDYKSIIRKAIQMGNDTDTTACIAGGMAAITHPVPEDWASRLVFPRESLRLLSRESKKTALRP